MRQPNYPRFGAIGVATPQANPTVEPEFQALAPDGVGVYVTRLTSQAKNSRLRLKNYLRQISRAAASFDTLPIGVLGFACTGSSYLLGRSEEARLVEAAGSPFPVITATRAIESALADLGARKIALISPYPDWLTEASVDFWRDGGYDITAVSRIAGQRDDTRSVYEVPEGYYFMMGDNRDNSQDSRFIGGIPETHLVGEAVRIWMHMDGIELPDWGRIGTKIQ